MSVDMECYIAYQQGYEAGKRDAASPWHRVEEDLPNDGEWAIFTNGKVVSVERFKEDAYNHFFPASQWFDFEDAIAWMPLPEPPNGAMDFYYYRLFLDVILRC